MYKDIYGLLVAVKESLNRMFFFIFLFFYFFIFFLFFVIFNN